MVNHYLLTLCPEAEDAILTTKMGPGHYFAPDGEDRRCLVGCAAGFLENGRMLARPRYLLIRNAADAKYPCVEIRYDRLCKRFGTDRTNAAIRNRILTNRASRTLRQVGALVA